MEQVTINHEKAKLVLEQAFKTANSGDYTPSSKFADAIHTVLFNTHLTFKYILVNALLAKASFPQINPICLQKKSTLSGAYDARSLCHKVLVPFERNNLNGALGNSNEPFLNKPARFTELSPKNAVRKGRDSMLLNLLCDFLPQINSQNEAFHSLTDALFYALQLAKNKQQKFNFTSIKTPTYTDIEIFIKELLEESYGGECLALAIGTLLKLKSETIIGENRVEVHVVNQSGASSKEVNDIDVYHEDEILYTIEAKDKHYSQQDVEHAVRKTAEAGCDRLTFITGPRAKFDGSHTPLVLSASKLGVYLTFTSYEAFTKNILSLILPKTANDFFKLLMHTCDEARVKEETLNHVIKTARNHQLIE
ncbi:restriction endonuclease, SacI family [Aneurinibacillus aneurinilyticus]|uniref:BanII n=2 Tax=Aneurinibacillus aneurinilyticus TaxID=1391 RepID=D9MYV2_ANEAE|nr:restriction endonuclease, SacI family [Aneurinibacillus aneurinilyticus]ADJ68007.1 BanII [Aneurinibacillus aneurinilyticus]ERI11866.1 SacI restriction endonuclease [Aneurinibacillus aneurinilyticus ATCC 12856]MED0705277.1 restriction endonuclease, SacI family [Aneurinibacillus aneurinilyticus]MED0722475.1 restriction endonuclease, SacI family [Aneurinibacillus aneurinilyticus]MED0733785.1 restriction endonuclease, SacI family [Aneurinibacillus aneurinilyticus]